ncbi:MAG: hypothetical protein NW214_16570 [Pseudanabaenaceae cyanobacterium bins.39]|nr:hypothetical protein [Pseudanabaenaceae cyanobacterium bins.39]
MNIRFKSLVVVASILGFAGSAYTISIHIRGQSQQAYTVANTKPGGGPRLPILGGLNGTSRLVDIDNIQAN